MTNKTRQTSKIRSQQAVFVVSIAVDLRPQNSLVGVSSSFDLKISYSITFRR